MRHSPGYGIMGKFMQRRSVVALLIFERFFQRQMNAVGLAIIESRVAVGVIDFCAGVSQNAFSVLNGLEGRMIRTLIGGDSFNLLGIEYCVDTVDQTASR